MAYNKNQNSGKKKPMSKRRKKLLLRRRLFLSGCFLLCVLIAVGAVSAFKHLFSQEESPSQPLTKAFSETETETETVFENTTLKQADEPSSTEPQTENKKDNKNETTSNVNSSKKSFYDGVTYRSPTAVPADIFKHGRNLMLLNNSYELPEDFEWNLVYWSNGQPVDAMYLNSSAYDSVKAVDKAAYEPLKQLFSDAAKAGVPLQLVSAYRSIDLQDRLFTRSVNSYINQGYSKNDAIKKANYARTFTGTSEHNSGYGFDILQQGNFTLSESFENTAQFKWLIENAENYGFILRYRKDKVSETGIMYEPWHFRYVGTEHAKRINELDMCLEEYIAYLDAGNT